MHSERDAAVSAQIVDAIVASGSPWPAAGVVLVDAHIAGVEVLWTAGGVAYGLPASGLRFGLGRHGPVVVPVDDRDALPAGLPRYALPGVVAWSWPERQPPA